MLQILSESSLGCGHIFPEWIPLEEVQQALLQLLLLILQQHQLLVRPVLILLVTQLLFLARTHHLNQFPPRHRKQLHVQHEMMLYPKDLFVQQLLLSFRHCFQTGALLKFLQSDLLLEPLLDFLQ